jgi:hypothetical protein
LILVLSAFAQRHGVRDMVVVADAGMPPAANLNALEDAGFGFIVGSRITKSLLENLPAVGRTDLDLPGQSPGVSLM